MKLILIILCCVTVQLYILIQFKLLYEVTVNFTRNSFFEQENNTYAMSLTKYKTCTLSAQGMHVMKGTLTILIAMSAIVGVFYSIHYL